MGRRFGYLIVTIIVLSFVLLAAPVAAAPGAIPNVPYGTQPLQNMTIYPASKPGSHLVVLVHGGGWATGSVDFVTTQALALQSAGFAVFNINYRLDSPTVAAFPTETDDVRMATRWAITHASTYNADPHHVTLIGSSAGGELVAGAVQILAPGTVRDVVTLSGAFDFGKMIQDGIAGTMDPLLAAEAARALRCPLTSCTASTEAKWSPVDHIVSTTCPSAWLLVNSADELMPIDQPKTMAGALRSKGCHVTETILPGTLHAVQYWSTEGGAVISFIRAHG